MSIWYATLGNEQKLTVEILPPVPGLPKKKK